MFSLTEDTGIPSLQTFVDSLTKQRREVGTQRLTRCIGQMLVDLHGYLTDEGTKVRYSLISKLNDKTIILLLIV